MCLISATKHVTSWKQFSVSDKCILPELLLPRIFEKLQIHLHQNNFWNTSILSLFGKVILKTFEWLVKFLQWEYTVSPQSWITRKTDYRRINATHFKSDSVNSIIGSHFKYPQQLYSDCHRKEKSKIHFKISDSMAVTLQWSLSILGLESSLKDDLQIV